MNRTRTDGGRAFNVRCSGGARGFRCVALYKKDENTAEEEGVDGVDLVDRAGKDHEELGEDVTGLPQSRQPHTLVMKKPHKKTDEELALSLELQMEDLQLQDGLQDSSDEFSPLEMLLPQDVCEMAFWEEVARYEKVGDGRDGSGEKIKMEERFKGSGSNSKDLDDVPLFFFKTVWFGRSPLTPTTVEEDTHGADYEGSAILIELDGRKGETEEKANYHIYLHHQILHFHAPKIQRFLSPVSKLHTTLPYAVDEKGGYCCFNVVGRQHGDVVRRQHGGTQKQQDQQDGRDHGLQDGGSLQNSDRDGDRDDHPHHPRHYLQVFCRLLNSKLLRLIQQPVIADGEAKNWTCETQDTIFSSGKLPEMKVRRFAIQEKYNWFCPYRNFLHSGVGKAVIAGERKGMISMAGCWWGREWARAWAHNIKHIKQKVKKMELTVDHSSPSLKGLWERGLVAVVEDVAREMEREMEREMSMSMEGEGDSDTNDNVENQDASVMRELVEAWNKGVESWKREVSGGGQKGQKGEVRRGSQKNYYYGAEEADESSSCKLLTCVKKAFSRCSSNPDVDDHNIDSKGKTETETPKVTPNSKLSINSKFLFTQTKLRFPHPIPSLKNKIKLTIAGIDVDALFDLDHPDVGSFFDLDYPEFPEGEVRRICGGVVAGETAVETFREEYNKVKAARVKGQEEQEGPGKSGDRVGALEVVFVFNDAPVCTGGGEREASMTMNTMSMQNGGEDKTGIVETWGNGISPVRRPTVEIVEAPGELSEPQTLLWEPGWLLGREALNAAKALDREVLEGSREWVQIESVKEVEERGRGKKVEEVGEKGE